MEYDPKCYYPGGWKTLPDGTRKKQIYSWESIEPAEVPDYELVAIKAEDNGFFVIDLDEVTEESAQWIEQTGLANTGTRKVATQGGGYHWYFMAPEGVVIPRMVGAIQGIDILGSGMVFCPPSPGYEVQEGGDEIHMAPDALLEAIEKAANKPVLERAGEQVVSGEVEEGTRNDRLFKQGMALRKAHNLEQRDIESCLIRENEERCNPPLGRAEVAQIASSVAGYEGSLDEPEPDLNESDFKPMTITELHKFAVTLPKVEQICGPFQTGTWGIIYGAPGVGKSRFVQAMTLHIAQGKDFFRWAVPKPRGVYYLDAEMSVHAVLERASQWPIRPDNFVYDLLQMREAHKLPGFELGTAAHTEWLKEQVGDAQVVVIDNVESTLVPHKDGIWSPSTWSQTQPLRDWIMTTNRLLIFVDHPNKGGDISGSESKRRGSWLNMRLTRESEPGDEDKLVFISELSKPARNDLPREQVARYGWRVDGGNQWHQETVQTRKEMAQELRSAGVAVKEIATSVERSEKWVYSNTHT